MFYLTQGSFMILNEGQIIKVKVIVHTWQIFLPWLWNFYDISHLNDTYTIGVLWLWCKVILWFSRSYSKRKSNIWSLRQQVIRTLSPKMLEPYSNHFVRLSVRQSVHTLLYRTNSKSFQRIDFILHTQMLDNERNTPIYFGSQGQRSML